MTKRVSTHRNDGKGSTGDENGSAHSDLCCPVSTIADSEIVALTGEQTILNREDDANLRKQAADLRQGTAELRLEAADLRQESAELRQNTADMRDVTADQRDDIADLRQNTADQREEIADLREEAADYHQDTAEMRENTADQRDMAADSREKALHDQTGSARVKAIQNAITEEHLREANENLVVATVRAQTMAETAVLATAQMSYMAEHDILTGLPNRALLTDRLNQSIALAQRHRKKFALLYIDLDHFKHINDSLGHEVGDKLLQSVAKRLQTCVRLTDTVSRQGGDEFVVLLGEVKDVQDATTSAKKLLEAMASPHLINEHRLHVNLSIGISLYPDDGKDIHTVIRNADTAMYYAKKNGRNCFHRFTSDMNVSAVARQSIEVALHHALEQHKFVLHYQPKVNLKTGTISGAEALVRLQQSDNRLVSPAKFVNIAEECGLIVPIGKWVLHEACRQTQAWLTSGLGIRQIAVNVSARELRNDFFEGVRSILNDTGLDPCRLELELTESGMMRDTEKTLEILYALKQLGVQIAVDDFGTGYSSLSYLRRFPIDTLKIDQTFVQDIGGEAGETIVSAVIAMGTSLKQRVVAEGIETKQQLDFLKSRHCDEGQGYYFGRPMSADEFATLLAAK
ncbi:MAG: EAL domain-containing protein [Desulfuromonadaceae bacterium]|nr:EAL domain-containing protein [Desulfuromonadaceae bacterium]MDD5106270.1 EAL domain-containing protein [Desulfuromonadaceae bacterium]